MSDGKTPIDWGGPIHPQGVDNDGGIHQREWFAGHAMAALLANPMQEAWDMTATQVANTAVNYADALIERLTSTKGGAA